MEDQSEVINLNNCLILQNITGKLDENGNDSTGIFAVGMARFPTGAHTKNAEALGLFLILTDYPPVLLFPYGGVFTREYEGDKHIQHAKNEVAALRYISEYGRVDLTVPSLMSSSQSQAEIRNDIVLTIAYSTRPHKEVFEMIRKLHILDLFNDRDMNDLSRTSRLMNLFVLLGMLNVSNSLSRAKMVHRDLGANPNRSSRLLGNILIDIPAGHIAVVDFGWNRRANSESAAFALNMTETIRELIQMAEEEYLLISDLPFYNKIKDSINGIKCDNQISGYIRRAKESIFERILGICGITPEQYYPEVIEHIRRVFSNIVMSVIIQSEILKNSADRKYLSQAKLETIVTVYRRGFEGSSSRQLFKFPGRSE